MQSNLLFISACSYFFCNERRAKQKRVAAGRKEKEVARKRRGKVARRVASQPNRRRVPVAVEAAEKKGRVENLPTKVVAKNQDRKREKR